MTVTIIDELAAIRDYLDDKRELVCAAHIQMAIDMLSARAPIQSSSDAEQPTVIKDEWKLLSRP